MSWERLWPVSGIAYAVLLAVPFLTDSSTGTTDAEITAFYADAGHRTLDTVLYFALLAAGLALVLFATGLRQAIRRETGSATLSDLAFGSGLASGALLVVTAAIWVSASAAHGDESFVLDPNTLRLTGTIGYWLLAASTTVGGLLVLATSLAGLRGALVWRWVAWLGIAVAVSTIAAVTFLPLILYVVWVLLLAVALIARAGARSSSYERIAVPEA